MLQELFSRSDYEPDYQEIKDLPLSDIPGNKSFTFFCDSSEDVYFEFCATGKYKVLSPNTIEVTFEEDIKVNTQPGESTYNAALFTIMYYKALPIMLNKCAKDQEYKIKLLNSTIYYKMLLEGITFEDVINKLKMFFEDWDTTGRALAFLYEHDLRKGTI